MYLGLGIPLGGSLELPAYACTCDLGLLRYCRHFLSLSLSLSSISLSSLSLLYFRGSASVSIASGLPLRRVQQDGGMRLNQVVPGCEKLLKC